MHLEAGEWEHYPAIFTSFAHRECGHRELVWMSKCHAGAGDGQRNSTEETCTWAPPENGPHLAIPLPFALSTCECGVPASSSLSVFVAIVIHCAIVVIHRLPSSSSAVHHHLSSLLSVVIVVRHPSPSVVVFIVVIVISCLLLSIIVVVCHLLSIIVVCSQPHLVLFGGIAESCQRLVVHGPLPP